MTAENTMNNTKNTTAAVPPAPNGHGASTGTTPGETRQSDTTNEGAAKDAPPSSKKKKRHQHNKMPASTPVESAADVTADQRTPAGPTGPAEPADPQTDELAATPIAQSAAAPIEAPVESLRLRMKVWTSDIGKRYLMPSAFMRDIVNGQPMTDVMYAYAMRDDDTKLVMLTAGEWNALPFFYFQEDGPAPRASTRPVDVVTP